MKNFIIFPVVIFCLDDHIKQYPTFSVKIRILTDYKSRGTLERSKISALSNSVPNLSASSPAIPHSEELRSASSMMTNPANNLLDHVTSSRIR